ncbi:hypothetical protein N9N28_09685 [Rubripirellula amarantea]|nr:hypothetical protein [Rubripirellula amarantea]
MRIVCLSLISVLLGSVSMADEASVDQPAKVKSAVVKSADVIVAVGAPGKPEYESLFRDWATKWKTLAEQTEVSLTTIGLDGESNSQTDSQTDSELDDKNDRDRLLALLQQQAQTDDIPLWIIFIGHGTFAEDIANFNLRGPDLSAKQLNESIANINRPIVFVNTTSSSGPFIDRLSGERRVIVTATKSGEEENFARFAGRFSDAIQSLESDIDHDDEVSVLEAFLKASKQVGQDYVASDQLATEHALIDDNGDAKGTPATMFRGHRVDGESQDGSAIDGLLASQITIFRSDSAAAPLSAEKMKRRSELESEHEALRQRRSELSDAEYDAALLPIMLEIADLYQ